MFFILSKILSFLIYPFNWSLLFLITAYFIKRKKLSKSLRIAALINLVFFSNTAIYQSVTSGWEQRYSIPQLTNNQSYNIVVLGGYSSMNEENKQICFNQAADRILQALPLFYQNDSNLLILTGGSANIYFNETPESDYLVKYLHSIQIPEERILIEAKSRNTYENALYTSELLDKQTQPKTVVLVTSAFHMFRAKACFEKQKMNIIPYPTQPMRSLTPLKPTDYFLPSLRTLDSWSILIKEWMGIGVYKLRSYI